MKHNQILMKQIIAGTMVLFLMCLSGKPIKSKTEHIDQFSYPTADALAYFVYNDRVFMEHGIMPFTMARFLQNRYIGEAKALPDKGLGEHVPESANAIPQLCGNASGMQVYTLHGVYSGSLLLVMDADGRAHLFKRK